MPGRRWASAQQTASSLQPPACDSVLPVRRTVLFTDIEGSTRLWEQHPQAMRDALAIHDEALVAALEGAGASWWKGTGDGFVAVFDSAAQAAAAALTSQQALEALGTEPALRIRAGMHSGEVIERSGDYFGQTMNRAARIMSTAHGGQTIASQASASELDLNQALLTDLGRPPDRGVPDPTGL